MKEKGQVVTPSPCSQVCILIADGPEVKGGAKSTGEDLSLPWHTPVFVKQRDRCHSWYRTPRIVEFWLILAATKYQHA